VILVVNVGSILWVFLTEHLSADYHVEIASFTAEADERMQSRHFNLVLVDHLMPGELGPGVFNARQGTLPENAANSHHRLSQPHN
jgi:DNA-binding response OmpR family regulator